MRRELVIAAGPGEWRAALVEDAEPVELRVERGDGVEAGSIHLGRVVRLLPALGAAQIDIGGARPAFLPQSQILPRGRRLAEGERVVVQIRREAQGGKAAQLTTAIAEQADVAIAAAQFNPPQRLFPAPSVAAALAGVFPAIDRILVDEPGSILEIRAAFPGSIIAHLPESEWPFDLDALFEEALSTTITLPGCGSIHFETSQAAVLIDVDSGTPEGGSPERTAITVNLAAASAIAHHIRLRNLAGGIIIDFVGLDDRRARERVRTILARCLARDRLQPQILGWTRLGHLELVRQRRARPLADQILEAAPGGAFIKTAATVAYEALRAVRRAARTQPGHGWRLSVAPEVAAALADEAAAALCELERRLGRAVTIGGDTGLGRDRFQIEPLSLHR